MYNTTVKTNLMSDNTSQPKGMKMEKYERIRNLRANFCFKAFFLWNTIILRERA